MCLLEKKFCLVFVGIFFRNFVWAICSGLGMFFGRLVLVLIEDVLAASFFLLLVVCVLAAVAAVVVDGFVISAPLALSFLAFLFFVILQSVNLLCTSSTRQLPELYYGTLLASIYLLAADKKRQSCFLCGGGEREAAEKGESFELNWYEMRQLRRSIEDWFNFVRCLFHILNLAIQTPEIWMMTSSTYPTGTMLQYLLQSVIHTTNHQSMLLLALINGSLVLMNLLLRVINVRIYSELLMLIHGKVWRTCILIMG